MLDGAGDAGGEADAVVGARDVVVHRLGDGDDRHPLVVQAHAVGQRVVAADRDQVVDAEQLEVLEHLGREVVRRRRRSVRAGGGGTLRARHVRGPGAGGVQEGAAGAARPCSRSPR